MTVGNVLEIAAGTGVVTRALVHTLPEAVNITATDLNPPMLDRARSHAGMGVHWQQADALALPFGEQEFDCVICQFGVMFFADKRAAFRETFRVEEQPPFSGLQYSNDGQFNPLSIESGLYQPSQGTPSGPVSCNPADYCCFNPGDACCFDPDGIVCACELDPDDCGDFSALAKKLGRKSFLLPH
jgi:SAM-dependent methyltransferase